MCRACTKYLDVREFPTTSECLKALQAEGWSIWATDLSGVSWGLFDRVMSIRIRSNKSLGRALLGKGNICGVFLYVCRDTGIRKQG
jgi:hypothetical protein